MLPHTITTDLVLSVGTLFLLCLFRFSRRYKQLPYPPSPKGLPFLGNIFDIPAVGQWAVYAEWARKLESPIISMDMLSMRIIILNDMNTVQDLFDKRSATYNLRPRMPWLNEAGGFDWDWGFTEDIGRWRVGRREFDVHFRQAAARRYRSKELTMAHELLYKLLIAPEDFMEHCRYAAGSVMLDLAYGMNDKEETEKFIHLAESGSMGIEKSGDRNIINILPWTRHIPSWLSSLPGMGWKRQVDEFREWGFSMRDVPFAWFKKQQGKGVVHPSVTADLLERLSEQFSDADARDNFIRDVVGAAYIGGSDTTVAMFRFTILVMVLYPDVQRRAQEELDRVIGYDRLPDFSDEPNLPYITAILKELLRWIAPNTAPHSIASDDVYNGYFLPKGSVIIGNTWAILHNPTIYPNPDIFTPHRFLTADGRLDPNVPDPTVAFGYGRRICPGRFMAQDTVWLVAASMLAAFNFKRAIGPDGQEIIPPADISFGLLNHPKPFKCIITPRSDKAVTLIRAAVAERNVETL